MVEHSWRYGGVCVGYGANTEKVGDYWVYGGGFLESPANRRGIITSSEGCPPFGGFTNGREGGFMEDQGCQLKVRVCDTSFWVGDTDEI